MLHLSPCDTQLLSAVFAHRAHTLALRRPIEEAFDNGYLCIIWEGARGAGRSDGQYRMCWLGDAELLMHDMKRYPWKSSAEKLPQELQEELRG